MSSGSKLALLIAIILFVAGAQRAVQPALAQRDEQACGMPNVKRPCDLTGFKLLTNQSMPALMILQIETKEGARQFVASRLIMERFAKELVQATEKVQQREKL
jgi:hypothetical protein